MSARLACSCAGCQHSAARQLPLRAAGKLLGLHSGDGRVLWSLNLDMPTAQAQLLPWQLPRNASRAPQVAVLAMAASGAAWVAVDAHSGIAVDGGSLHGEAGTIQVRLAASAAAAAAAAAAAVVHCQTRSGSPAAQVLPGAAQHASAAGEQSVYLISRQTSSGHVVDMLPEGLAAQALLPSPIYYWTHDTLSGKGAPGCMRGHCRLGRHPHGHCAQGVWRGGQCGA